MTLCVVLLTSCCGNKPSATVKQYMDYIKDGKFQEASELLYVKEDADAEETKALCEKVGAIFEAEGGVESYEIVSENIAEDGQTAVVEVKVTYKRPQHIESNDPIKFNMRKVDKKWLVDLSDK